MQKKADQHKSSERQRRHARLAQELRANLLKRKAQRRGRQNGEDDGTGVHPLVHRPPPS